MQSHPPFSLIRFLCVGSEVSLAPSFIPALLLSTWGSLHLAVNTCGWTLTSWRCVMPDTHIKASFMQRTLNCAVPPLFPRIYADTSNSLTRNHGIPFRALLGGSNLAVLQPAFHQTAGSLCRKVQRTVSPSSHFQYVIPLFEPFCQSLKERHLIGFLHSFKTP